MKNEMKEQMNEEINVKDLTKIIDETLNTQEDNVDERKKKIVLYVIDTVNGFLKEGPMADPEIMRIVPQLTKLIKTVKENGGETVFINEGHSKNASEFSKFPKHCIEGTKEAEIIDELKEYAADSKIYTKNSTCGVFADKFLEEFLEQYGDADEIVVSGCCTDICISNFLLALINYCDQHDRKIKFILPIDVCETYNSPDHDRDEYKYMTYKLLKQAGVKIVESYNEEMKEVDLSEDRFKSNNKNELNKEKENVNVNEKENANINTNTNLNSNETYVKKLIDFYELTMAYSDFLDGKNNSKCYFDVFFRKNLDNGGYNVSCGLEEIIDVVKNFKFDDNDIEYLRSLGKFNEEFLTYLKDFKFTGDIYAVPDGTPIFPSEPCITVVGNSIEAQLLETDILNRFNHGSMIATKIRRIVNEAGDRPVMEFGARRAQGDSAAAIGAKYAYIGGAVGTSCFETGKKYGVPVLGTMAHSHVMKYDSEEEAFERYAKAFPDSSLFLVDTYDTLKSGIPNAIKVARETLLPNGHRLSGIRLDSGDLAYLSKESRKMLDKAGLNDAKICVSNSLDEYLIRDLLSQGAPIDSFGVGENLITSKNCPVFGGVYKLAAIEQNGKLVPKIKLSNNSIKITNPGYKKVYRFYDKKTGYAKGDVIALYDEEISKDKYKLVNDKEPWKSTTLTNYEVRELQVPIFKDGNLVYDVPKIDEARRYADSEIKTLYPEIMRLNNPHEYYVDLSENLASLKREMITETSTIKEEESTMENHNNEDKDKEVDIRINEKIDEKTNESNQGIDNVLMDKLSNEERKELDELTDEVAINETLIEEIKILEELEEQGENANAI